MARWRAVRSRFFRFAVHARVVGLRARCRCGATMSRLRVNAVCYLEKAPLPYWLVASSYRIFAANEFATRLPMALSLLLLGMLALRRGRRVFGEHCGFRRPWPRVRQLIALTSLLLRLRRRHSAAIWAGGRNGNLPGRGAYCAGALRALSFVEAPGARERRPGPTGRQDHDLWRSGLRIVLGVLSAPADRSGGRPNHFEAVRGNFADAPKIFLSDTDLLRRCNGSTRTFPFAPAHQKVRVEASLPYRSVFAEMSGKYISSNRP
jgi:hypothetical protein